MSDSKKLYSAREAALAVLAKTKDILKESPLLKAEYKTENDPKPGIKYGKIEKDQKPIERDYEEYEVKKPTFKDSTGKRLEKQVSPSGNPKEAAEGNNKPDGMEPDYEFKDKISKELEKEKASHMVKSQSGMHTVMYKKASMKKTESTKEMVDSDVSAISHKANYLKELMHQIGESKDTPAWMLEKISQAKAHIQDVMDFVVGHEDMEKSEKLKKGEWKKIHDKLEREGYSKKAADRIDGAIKAKLGKGENPDEKADAELGEKVEHDVEQHMLENKDAEEKEGHEIMKKPDNKMEGQTESNVIPRLIGSAKLSKFMEHMHSKRKNAQQVGKQESDAPMPGSTQSGKSESKK